MARPLHAATGGVSEIAWSADEVSRLVSLLTVGETYFFRDASAFAALGSVLLPELVAAGRERGRRLTVWSAGCSTGEEIYSVTILLRQVVRDLDGWNLTLLGTDVNPDSLEAARQGCYGAWSFREKLHGLRPEWCTPADGGRFAVRPEIHRKVAFRPCNLVADAAWPLPADSVDLLLCRNVLMYFRRDRAMQVLHRLIRTLRPGGILLLGASEGHFGDHPELALRQVDSSHCFVRKFDGEERPHPAALRTQSALASPARSRDAEIRMSVVPSPRRVEAPPPVPPFRLQPSVADERLASPESVLRRARELADRGQLAQAQQWAETAVRLQPLQAAPHLLLGIILQEQEQLAEAKRSFRNAAFLDPHSVLASFHLGMLALRQQRPAEAGTSLRRTLQLLQRAGTPTGAEPDEDVSPRELRRMIHSALEQIHEHA
jgi:chemotaxis protein methyltransferase CheR